MQVEKKSGRGRTYRHIFFSLDNSLGFMADDVLIQSIRSFRDAVEEREQESATEEDRRYCKEMRQALSEMRAEARRRSLKVPEEEARRARKA